MKQKKNAILAGLFLLMAVCQNLQAFDLKGNIEGLEVGDTIVVQSVVLPLWEIEYADTLIVAQQNRFEYHKPHANTSLLLVNHLPKGRKAADSPIRGATVLVGAAHRVKVSGNAEYFAIMECIGGFYDDTLVARYTSLGNEQNRKDIDAFRKMEEFRAVQQTDSVAKYSKLYNSKASDEYKTIKSQLVNDVQDNEFSAYLYLTELYDKTYPEISERLEKYTPEVRQSHLGQRIEGLMHVFKNIEVGNAPDPFTVTDREGNRVSLSDYRGKYLLIYHWGLCPGTIWVHPRLLDLYEKYHDKGFEVLGFTQHNQKDFQFIEETIEKEGSKSLGRLNEQPWTTVVTEESDNESVTKDLYFSGVPILMLISPEGKTLIRGYSGVFKDIEKELNR